jgi:hypothetical protein
MSESMSIGAEDVATLTGDPVTDAVAQITAAAAVSVSVGSKPGTADMPEVKFDRLSIERRVLGHITDDVEHTVLGARNTLAALTYSIMRDRNTTHAPAPNPSLDIDGKSLVEVAQTIHEHVGKLTDAGLVAQREDGSYALTEAGHKELAS